MDLSTASYGYLLPTRGMVLQGGDSDFSKILDLARHAERSGFTSLWVGDSVLAKPRLEPMTTLAAVAAACPKSIIGTAVLLPALRQPVVLAHALSTLDIISDGRLIVGVGNGGPFEIYKKEFAGCGIPFKQRISRTNETVQVLKRLWSEDHVSFTGKTCTLEDVSLSPKPKSRGGPKILMSAGIPLTDASIANVAAISDGWMTAQVFPSEFKETWAKIKSLSRQSEEMIPSLYMTINVNKDEATARKETTDYLQKYYGAPPHLERWGPLGHPSAVAEGINRYFDAGVRVFSIRFSSFDQEKQVTSFVDEVLPHLKR